MGNSANRTIEVAYITLPEDVVTEVLKNVCGKPDFKDFKASIHYEDDLTDLEEIILEKKDFDKKRIDYDNYKISFNQKLLSFSDAELARMCLGDFRNTGEEEHVKHIPGQAGETVSTIEKIDKYLTLVDGPAGLRITKRYEVVERDENNEIKNTKVYHQYATAIPSATALAQSFNEELLEIIGNVVGNEMDIFNAHLWLAPALNIHRNILNGRNFEYYSEDPLLSGKMAAAITRGVQRHKNRGTTIKHFACNGQEMNRFNSNSILSERALREIYLKGFKIAIEESNPISLMTSYNLINGKHSSERRDLLIDVVRIEWGYNGLIMSDWYTSNQIKIGNANQPSQNAVPNIINGNNLQMGINKNDYDLIMKSVQEGNMKTLNLIECASKVYDTILLLNQ
jgi:beta-glucosidase